jgi:hypothetical protein
MIQLWPKHYLGDVLDTAVFQPISGYMNSLVKTEI